jgi:transposase
VARYGQALKERTVARLLPPESAAIAAVSQELGASVLSFAFSSRSSRSSVAGAGSSTSSSRRKRFPGMLLEAGASRI